VLGESRDQTDIPERERDGLYHILTHIGDNLGAALTKL
jgi:hypothetical protein